MHKRPNPMKFFSGSALTRLPLYKVLAGGLAALTLASAGLGAMAVGFAGTPPTPTPPVVPAAAVATPTPRPTFAPEETPEPTVGIVQLYTEVTVVQQDIGVQLYYLADFTDEDNKSGSSLRFKPGDPTAGGQPLHVPWIGKAAQVVITPAEGTEGEAKTYDLDTATGTVLAEEVAPGQYTVTVSSVQEGYLPPEEQTVTVEEKVEYKADTEAVKDKIVQAAEVNEKAEDAGYSTGGAPPLVDEVTDTVTYAESARKESRQTVYTAELADGHLKDKAGQRTDYLPVLDKDGNLIAAQRETAAITLTGLRLPLVQTAAGGAFRTVEVSPPADLDPPDPLPSADGDASPAPDETVSPAPETTPTSEPTAAPEETPTPEVTATPTPAETPAPSESPTPAETPTPEATATPAPTETPAPTPTPTPWPDKIEGAALETYFLVTKTEKVTYEYTGWQNLDGITYYYDPATHQPVTGTQVILGVLYQFSATGALNQTSRGIDVSTYQGNIDWNAVKADGIDFAIIRVGYRGYGSGKLVEDSRFAANIRGATAAGLKVGVYFFTQAINEAEAVEEASMVLSLVQGYGLPMGVWFDTENSGASGNSGRADGISAAQRTACAVAFCETIRNAGYSAGVYSYASWFYNQLNFANISKYRTWIAQYRDTLSFNYKYDIWQYSSNGSVNGIPNRVDMNIG